MTEQTVLAELPEAIAQAEQLPSPPAVALEVLRLAQQEDAAIGDLATVIERDPALAVKLVKLANSSMFRRGDPVTALEAATVRLGMKAVKLMALSFSLTRDLPRDGEMVGFSYPTYWAHSLTTAAAARGLARLVRNPRGDEAFLCGLLARLGQLVMAETIGDQYREVARQDPTDLPIAATETRILGFDFHEVGSALLESWELPALVHHTTRYWGAPSGAPIEADAAELCCILHVADILASVICGPHCGMALTELHEKANLLLGVSSDEVDTCLLGLQEEVAELGEMLSVDVTTESFQSILDRARHEIVQVSLGAAADLQATATRADELEKKNQELTTQAHTDALTGIPNRAHFDTAMQRVVHARLAGRSHHALGALMIDVDHFKSFNDTHGHQVGDAVLRHVAQTLVTNTRRTDIAARYGGEEFVVILPNTSVEDLRTIAERLRNAIESTPLAHEGHEYAVTVSLGGACVASVSTHKDGTMLLSLADECLYEAKRKGRNQAVCVQVDEA